MRKGLCCCYALGRVQLKHFVQEIETGSACRRECVSQTLRFFDVEFEVVRKLLDAWPAFSLKGMSYQELAYSWCAAEREDFAQLINVTRAREEHLSQDKLSKDAASGPNVDSWPVVAS